MEFAAGLRRAVPGESLPKGENGVSVSLLDYNDRKPSLQQAPHGFKIRSVINKQCMIGFVTITTLALLVVRFGFSPFILGSSVSDVDQFSEDLSLFVDDLSSESTHAKLRRSDASFEGGDLITQPARPRPRNADILARMAQKNVVPNCVADDGMDSALGIVSQAYHSPQTFYQDFQEMACRFKIFIYPHSVDDPFASVFESYTEPPTGNYASEHYFKMALWNSSLVTEDPTEADLFYMPFSIATMRNHPQIGVEGIKHFVKNYVGNISVNYPYWNRSSGADHFYVNCHSIGKTATYEALHVRTNAIQIVCSSSYHIEVYLPHKDATIPQVWPRTGFPEQAPFIEQRTTLAFFAGAGNSPVRQEVGKYWINDTEIKVYTHRISTPYDEALLTSKYCLHVKGYEVNTARLADAMHYGCVPVIIADHYDLPFNDVLDWTRFSLVVERADIPRLKDIIKAVSDEEYVEMQKNVMQVRQHFEWHQDPQHFDAFYMVMYELWLRRHVVRFPTY